MNACVCLELLPYNAGSKELDNQKVTQNAYLIQCFH